MKQSQCRDRVALTMARDDTVSVIANRYSSELSVGLSPVAFLSTIVVAPVEAGVKAKGEAGREALAKSEAISISRLPRRHTVPLR